MFKLWLLRRTGKLSQKQYLVEKNILLGQKVDAIREQRKALKLQIVALETGVQNG